MFSEETGILIISINIIIPTYTDKRRRWYPQSFQGQSQMQIHTWFYFPGGNFFFFCLLQIRLFKWEILELNNFIFL